jgi:chemotaxis-related protein WspD
VTPLQVLTPSAATATEDCWNRIGVRGDHSCPELPKHAHCQNCPTQRNVAAQLLRGPAPEEYAAEWTAFYARPEQEVERGVQSIFIFRIENEWLALPASVVTEVTKPRRVHSVPHRRGGVVQGLVNVRGELLVCASLTLVLGLTQAGNAGRQRQSGSYPRFLVLRRADVRAVCPVDDVHGVEKISASDLKALPTTVRMSADAYSHRLLEWKGRSVGLLDAPVLMATLKRRFA